MKDGNQRDMQARVNKIADESRQRIIHAVADLNVAINRVKGEAPMDEATHIFDMPAYEAAILYAAQAAEECRKAAGVAEDTGMSVGIGGKKTNLRDIEKWLDDQQKAIGAFFDEVRGIANPPTAPDPTADAEHHPSPPPTGEPTMSDPHPTRTTLDDPAFKDALALLDEDDCLLALRLWGIAAKDQPTEAEAGEMSGGRLAFRDLALTDEIAAEIALWSVCLAAADTETERVVGDEEETAHRVYDAAVELYRKREPAIRNAAEARLSRHRRIETAVPPSAISPFPPAAARQGDRR